MSAILLRATGSPSAHASGIPPDIVKITFPLLFGPLVNWALYGVLCVQIYVYSYNFPNDGPLVKLLAYSVFLLETAQTALTGADVYYWFVEGFGNVERIKDSHFAPIDIPIIHSIISFVVQGFLCYRIWTLNRQSSKLCMVIALFTILQSIGAMWGGIESILAGGKYAVSKAALYLWSIPSAISDVLIAIAMLLLQTRTRNNGSRFSNFVMTRLVRLTIESNALTASVAVASFILFVAFPHYIYYVFLVEFITKLYSNTLLVSLNNRIYFRDSTDDILGIHMESIHPVEVERGNTTTHRSAMTSPRLSKLGLLPTRPQWGTRLSRMSFPTSWVWRRSGDPVSIAADSRC